ncbi:MAG TPA: hypothetical protein EYQ26_12815 [Rhodospirillales bacterium]|nr:hypothetical protein [Rhodospirillales bacterium]
MKHLELINQFREGLAEVSREVELSSAMCLYDINSICENLFCGVFRELYGLSGLRNLNEDEKKNFPGIDLADDQNRVAIQITSDKTLEKVKDTIKKIKTYKLYEKYDRFIVYCLSAKQGSYSQASIDRECDGKLKLNASKDIIDFKDLGTKAANADPQRLKKIVDILGSYQRGCDVGLAEQDFDPPIEPAETLLLNLVELYLPSKLYIADVQEDILKSKSGKKLKNQRKAVGNFSRENGQPLPSGYEVYSGKLITFFDLEDDNNPFTHLIEDGTAECLSPTDYHEIDENYERIFKSLLRLSLQQKLYKHNILWQFKEGLFIFLPTHDNQNVRSESWYGKKQSSRTVFERKFKTNKPDEILQIKHFAFYVNFLLIDNYWYIAITPDWFFSWGDSYRRSPYADKPLSGLKRLEKNKSVCDQFRFLASWLKDIDEADLFEAPDTAPTLTFGNVVKLEGGRSLNETLWESLSNSISEEDEQGSFIDDY